MYRENTIVVSVVSLDICFKIRCNLLYVDLNASDIYNLFRVARGHYSLWTLIKKL